MLSRTLGVRKPGFSERLLVEQALPQFPRLVAGLRGEIPVAFSSTGFEVGCSRSSGAGRSPSCLVPSLHMPVPLPAVTTSFYCPTWAAEG